MVRIGVDIGGTFTDFIILTDTGTILATKVHSTSLKPSRAFLKGIESLLEKEKISSHDVHFLGHGTTICTNALLEGKVPTTGLLTTKGFRDVLEIGRQNRPTLYDLFFDRPEPLISRRHRREILERINADGTIETPLNQEDVVREVQFLKEDGVTNIAVCYLFSYVNPSHEMETKRLIVKTYSEMDVSISTEIAPIYREYERTATTCANATLRGVMIAYLEALQGLTGGLYEKLAIFDNAGGLLSPEAMKERPVYALLSGPSAGVAATSYLSARIQEPSMIGFDMGGTSCDVCLLYQGVPEMRRQITVRQPVQIRSIDIETIGAGGGSIAWVDRGGALHVGPRSAGADPGPACYARRGTDPTVTDANLVAGRLGPEGLLGGEYPLDENLAREALQQIDPDPEKASAAILQLVCTNMAMAVRKVSIERGYDPRDFILCAFGGAGPLHAAVVADMTELPRVLVPPFPGNFSAFGLLCSRLRHDLVKTIILPLSQEKGEVISTLELEYAQITSNAISFLEKEGLESEEIIVNKEIDLRYSGQAYELTLPFEGDLIASFHKIHRKKFGWAFPENVVETVNIRVTALGPSPHVKMNILSIGNRENPKAAIKVQRKVYTGVQYENCKIYDRSKLLTRDRIVGPALIEEFGSTTWLPPDAYLEVIKEGALMITLKQESK